MNVQFREDARLRATSEPPPATASPPVSGQRAPLWAVFVRHSKRIVSDGDMRAEGKAGK